MISFYNIDFSPLLDLSFSSIVIEDIRSEWTVNIHSLANASGMTYSEVLDFLDSKEVGHNAFKTSHDAVVELRDWYLKKVRRYVRNGLALELDPGSQDEILFLQFCDRYRKIGCNEVKSWDDIDETRLLQDFEAKCLYDLPLFAADLRGSVSLLDRIHRSFLFHLRLKKTPKHNECRAKTILSIILCNRYHIFTAEADSDAKTTETTAYRPDNFMFYPPRSASLQGFALMAKA